MSRRAKTSHRFERARGAGPQATTVRTATVCGECSAPLEPGAPAVSLGRDYALRCQVCGESTDGAELTGSC